uniref:Uncharacterized protein n=1 Tax=viral metagenome TaxID=1070528 RepID=A0A6M3X4A3_9ZZZZ
MERKYKITPKQQYDRDGATVWHGRHNDNLARYRADGTYDCGQPVPVADMAAVTEAVMRVIATRQTEILICGEPEKRLTDAEVAAIEATSARMREWQRTDI